MKRVEIFKNLAIFLLCIICISGYADAYVTTRPVKENDIAVKPQKDIVIHNLMNLMSIVKHVPLVGPILDNVFAPLINFIILFEYETNHILDKILSDALPCSISSTQIHCEGIKKNGGLSNILRDAVDSMPDTAPLFIVKRILDLTMVFGTLFLTSTLY